MKLRVLAIAIAALFLLVPVARCQSDSMIHVKEFPGVTVGDKVSAAMANCPKAPIPCILVIDASLAAAAPGTMPALCPNCSLEDYRDGALPSNGGTIQGAIIDKGGQVINVKAYGASGDGTTNDAPAIQLAVNAAIAAGGGVVYFPTPSVSYSITSTVDIPSPTVKLVGPSQLVGSSFLVTCNVSSGDCFNFSPNVSTFRDSDGGLYHFSIWLSGSNQVCVHTVDFIEGFHLVDFSCGRSSATTGVGSVGWLAENSGAFTQSETERSVLNHASFQYVDVGIKGEDTATSGLHNSIEHSDWQDVRWNLGTNQTAIELGNDTNIADSVINGTVNTLGGSTGVTIFSLPSTSQTYHVMSNIWIDGTGSGVIGASVASGASLYLDGILSNYASVSCAGSCWLPPSNGAFGVYGNIETPQNLTASGLVLGDGSTHAGQIQLMPGSPGGSYVWLVNNDGTFQLSTGGTPGARPFTYNASNGNISVFGSASASSLVLSGTGCVSGSYAKADGTGCAPGSVTGTMIGSATTASHTFATAFTATPICEVSPETNSGAFYISSKSATAITVTYATSGASTWDVICRGDGGAW